MAVKPSLVDPLRIFRPVFLDPDDIRGLDIIRLRAFSREPNLPWAKGFGGHAGVTPRSVIWGTARRWACQAAGPCSPKALRFLDPGIQVLAGGGR